MNKHDPLCPHTVPWPPQIRCDMCALIARTRSDERAKVYRPDAHQMMLERDAARAEVAAARDRGFQEGYDAAISVANEKFGKRTREVLADLRAKVEGLAEEDLMADSPGLIWKSDVLALIDKEL